MRLLERDEGIGFGERRRRPGRGADHELADARRLHDRQAGGRLRLGLGPRRSGSAPSRSRCWPPSSCARRRRRNPLIPLRIFRSRNVSGANVIQALTVAGMFGMFFLGSLYLQRVLGYDALQIGLAFLPATLVMGTLSLRYAEPLIMRFGARTTLLPGLVLIAVGLALFTRAPVDGSYVQHVLPVMILLGFGDRRLLPGADDAGDVGRHAGGRGPGLRPRQHHGAGRRRARPRGARDAVRHAQRQPDRERGQPRRPR